MATALGAHFMFSIMVLLAKLLSENHSVIEIAFYRNLVGSLPFLFVVYALGRRDILKLNTKPLLVGLRAVIGTISLTITFLAYSLMPLADTTALLFTSSLFIPVLLCHYKAMCTVRNIGSSLQGPQKLRLMTR